MNTNNLKKYAPQARRDFMAAVSQRLNQLGIATDGKAKLTVSTPVISGSVMQIEGLSFDAGLARAREKLVHRAESMGFEALVEQMAYTWFNRLSAIRFMELHGYLDHNLRVLSSGEGRVASGELWMPEILDHAQDVADALGLDRNHIVELKLAGNKDEALYRLLLLGQCHHLHQAMPFLFEALDDETELLLPDNLTRTDSILRGLVDSIPEDDWQQVEIIGWLYQFYISEKKDQVIGSVVKSEDIPAATQLFTPNWIVKYLVQNSVGRQWLMTYPDSGLKARMEYYIEVASDEWRVVSDENKKLTTHHSPLTTSLNPEDLKILDPACGSGHILVEAYDILKAIYIERGYRVRDIPKLILEKNLYGLDIDDRAAQLAGFALMMKARADDRRIFSRGVKLNVLALAESRREVASGEWRVGSYGLSELLDALDLEGRRKAGENLDLFERVVSDECLVASDETKKLTTHHSSLATLLALFEQAKTLGSLIQVPHEQAEFLRLLTSQLQELVEQGDTMQKPAAMALLPYVHQAWLLAEQYDAVVANPPYMGGKGMNAALKEFAKKQFPDSKSDLFAMFMERFLSDEWLVESGERLAASGKWQVASERRDSYVAMVTMQSWMFLSSYESLREKLLSNRTISTMAHLGARAFPEISGEVVQTTAFVFRGDYYSGYKPAFFRLVDGNEQQKHTALLSGQNRFDKIVQDDFKKIPGSPISYWLSAKSISAYKANKTLTDYVIPAQGSTIGENDKFLRLWSEIDWVGRKKWKVCLKGGPFRKWYGNRNYLVFWGNNGDELKSFEKATIRNQQHINKPGIDWSRITSSINSFRIFDGGEFTESGGGFVYTKENTEIIAAFLNSKISKMFLEATSPTINCQTGDVANLPFINPFRSVNSSNCYQLAKDDWNNYETSWDFTEDPLIRHKQSSLKAAFEQWQAQNQAAFAEMQRLEEENNRIFIGAYGLQDELTPEVPEDQITLTRADQEKDIQRLISYAIGCMMGRYRLDKPGLIYAHAGNVDFWQIYEGEVSDEWLVASGEKNPPTHHSPLTTSHLLPEGANNEQRGANKELPGFDRVAEIDGIGGENLSNDQGVSERGVIRANESDSSCGGVDSIEHCRGASAEINSGISQFSIDSAGIESGSRNANTNSATSGLCNEPTNSGNNESAGRDFPNAQQSTEQTALSDEGRVANGEKNTHHSPLTTRHFFNPDEDGILPLTDQEWFKDDASNRFREFLVAVWGEDTLQQNLEFVAESLTLSSLKPKKGETSLDTVRRYLSNQFYKDHLQTYKKRPIYWLFSSGKQKAFECLVYLHRYNDSTLARMRTEYVTPLLGKYSAYADQLNQQLQDASSSEATRIKKEIQALEKKQTELRQFDDKLKHYADMRIKLDLDDGVKVNYGKFGDLLAEVKAVTGGKGD